MQKRAGGFFLKPVFRHKVRGLFRRYKIISYYLKLEKRLRTYVSSIFAPEKSGVFFLQNYFLPVFCHKVQGLFRRYKIILYYPELKKL